MYLLSYENSVEFESKFRSALVRGRQPWLDSKQNGAFLKRIRTIDPGYDFEPTLSHETQKTLQILLGIPSSMSEEERGFRSSGFLTYRGTLFPAEPKLMSNLQRRNVARAMVLSEIDFGFFDAICVQDFEAIFSTLGSEATFSGTALTVGGKYRSKFGPLDWDEFLSGPLSSYLLPTRRMVSPEGVERPDLMLTIGTPQGKISLELAVKAVGAPGLRWSTRSISGLKKDHGKLVDRLNAVLDDYAERLNWLESYRSMPVKEGLSPSQLKAVESEMNTFFRDSYPEYSILLKGISFGDDPLIFDDNRRGYILRCETCSRIAAIEIISNYQFQNIDWSDHTLHRSMVVEKHVNKPLKRFHSESGCSGKNAVSSRTGGSTSINGIG